MHSRRRFLALAAVSLAALTGATSSSAESVAGRRVGLQVGHWLAAEMPAELARLRTQTGTYGGGVNEWELALDIARRAARRLEAEGVEVDILPATVPPGYLADAFVAIHADGDATGRFSGYKLARSSRSLIPQRDDALVEAITETYGEATGLPLDDHISRGMLGYYAYSGRVVHSISRSTPSAIIEMGFMTHPRDLAVLLGSREAVAAGISRGIYRFLAAQS